MMGIPADMPHLESPVEVLPASFGVRLEILLLCDYRPEGAATVSNHIDALVNLSGHRVRKLSMLREIPSNVELERFDAVIVHYSLVASSEVFINSRSRKRLAGYSGLKALFIQDEYRHVDQSIAAMREIGIDVLFTCVPPGEIPKVYPDAKLPGVTKVNTLTGYVPAELLGRSVAPAAQRAIDVGYRGRTLPAWLGELGQEKWRIGDRFLCDAARYDLVCDISFREQDRIYGERWVDFLCQCKAMLGVESGASVFDFTGSIQRLVDAHVAQHPDTSFEELRDLYFGEEEGRILLNQISPRSFEAAALRTMMILYEGEYSGILTPWRHYVPLAKDHSNMDEVVAILKDPCRIDEITELAYREIALNPEYSYAGFVAEFDRVIERQRKPFVSRSLAAYSDEGFTIASRPSLGFRLRRMIRTTALLVYLHLFRRLILLLPGRTQVIVKEFLRRTFLSLIS